MHPATRRIWAGLPPGTRAALSDLAPTDLQSLLIDLARLRAERVDAAELVRRWRGDRFVRPADVDPRLLARLESNLWQALPEEFVGVELSPVAPLGTCAAVGPVDQNRIVTTVRTSEVVSDPTNVLALEAARRRRSTAGPVHLAACHRVLRAQQFPPGFGAHFSLFALTSSGRDRGSWRTELDFLELHLRAWRTMVGAVLGERWFLDQLLDLRRPRAGRPGPGRARSVTSAPPRGRRAAARSGLLRAAGDQDRPDRAGRSAGGRRRWLRQLDRSADGRCEGALPRLLHLA